MDSRLAPRVRVSFDTIKAECVALFDGMRDHMDDIIGQELQRAIAEIKPRAFKMADEIVRQEVEKRVRSCASTIVCDLIYTEEFQTVLRDAIVKRLSPAGGSRIRGGGEDG